MKIKVKILLLAVVLVISFSLNCFASQNYEEKDKKRDIIESRTSFVGEIVVVDNIDNTKGQYSNDKEINSVTETRNTYAYGVDNGIYKDYDDWYNPFDSNKVWGFAETRIVSPYWYPATLDLSISGTFWKNFNAFNRFPSTSAKQTDFLSVETAPDTNPKSGDDYYAYTCHIVWDDLGVKVLDQSIESESVAY